MEVPEVSGTCFSVEYCKYYSVLGAMLGSPHFWETTIQG